MKICQCHLGRALYRFIRSAADTVHVDFVVALRITLFQRVIRAPRPVAARAPAWVPASKSPGEPVGKAKETNDWGTGARGARPIGLLNLLS
jgi:hypothetical protein